MDQKSTHPPQPVVAVFDKKTGLYDNPVTVRHIGEAVREWDTLVKNKQTKYGLHPEDFDLYQIAIYDYGTGTLTTLSPHIQLASGVQ